MSRELTLFKDKLKRLNQRGRPGSSIKPLSKMELDRLMEINNREDGRSKSVLVKTMLYSTKDPEIRKINIEYLRKMISDDICERKHRGRKAKK